MAYNEKTQTFDVIDDLRLRRGSEASRITVLGYYIAGDGGYGQYYYDSTSSETDNGGTVIKPTAVSGAGRWKLLHNGTVNAANFGVTTGATSQNARITAALAVTDIKTLVFNHLVTKSYTIASAITVPSGVVIRFDNDNKFIFSGGSLSGGIIECDFRKQCFGGDLTVTGLENTIKSAAWFGAKSDTTSSVTGTDCLIPAQKAVDASVLPSKVYFPRGLVSTSFYYFSAPWTVSKSVEIFGDGYKGETNFKFPGNGAGIILNAVTGGQRLRDMLIRGVFSGDSTGFNSSTAHGVTVSSNDCALQQLYIIGFDGDGIRVNGSTLNANSFKIVNCRVYFNGRAGSYCDGDDSNAGRFEGLVAQGNARAGIWDDSFLGNIYDGGSIGTNVYPHPLQQSLVHYRAAVSHGGNRYRAIAAGTNKEPGVAGDWATYWVLIGAGGVDATYQVWSNSRTYAAPATYWARIDSPTKEPTVTSDWENEWRDFSINAFFGVEWDATTTYYMGAAQIYQNLNGRSLVDGLYNEGDGPVEIKAPTLLVGGTSAEGSNSNGIWGATGSRIFTNSGWRLTGIPYAVDCLTIGSDRIGVQSFIRMTDDISAGYVDILGGQTDGFTPIIRLHPMNAPTGSGNTNSYIYADGPDTGSTAALVISSRNLSAGTLTTQPVLDIRNDGTSMVKIAADGSITNSFLAGSGNRVLYASSAGLIFPGAIDATPTNGSTNAVQSDGVFDALALKQNALTLTTTGTSGAATLVSGVLNIPQYSGTSGADALGRYIVQIATNAPANAQILASLSTGIMKVTTTTGVISTAVAGTDYLTPTGSAAALTSFPTFNQSTTGSAATLTTSRNIQGVAFNGSANIDIINGTGFVKATGTTISYDNSTYLTTASAASTYQPLDTDLTTIAGLTATTNNFIVSSASAWASRTPAQVNAILPVFTTALNGLVPLSGSAAGNFLRDDGTWQAITGGGDALVANPLSQFAATTSAQLAGVISDETGTDKLVFNTSPGFATAINPISSDGAALGTTALMWSDLFLASGSVINFNNGDVTMTHTSNALTLIGGALEAIEGFFTHTTNAASSFGAATGTSAAVNTSANLSVLSAAATTYRAFINGGNYTIPTTNYNYASLAIGGNQVTEGTSGKNHPLISSLQIKAPVIVSGAATVDNTATVYIESAPSTTVTGGNYSIWVDAGETRLDGIVTLGSTINKVTITAPTTSAILTLIDGSSLITAGAFATTLTATATTNVTLPTTGTLATLAGTETFTNKTLTSPVINVGSDAANDIYYRNGSGVFTRLANGTTGQFLSANTGAAPAWSTPAGSGDVTKVGTPADNQIGIWTGNGTIEGSAQLTFTGQALQLASTNTTQATTSSILAVAANSLTTGTAQYIASSTITTGNLLNLVTTGTAAAAGNEALNIDRSGANGTSSITVTGARITLANTGTTSTNVGLDIAVSGASTNTAITANSDVEVTDTTKGFILKSPDGTRWRLTIADTGVITATSL